MEHCASGMDSENRIVVGKPDVSQGRKVRSFLLYFLQAEGSSAAIVFPARGWLLQSFFCVYGFFGRSKERKRMTVTESETGKAREAVMTRPPGLFIHYSSLCF